MVHVEDSSDDNGFSVILDVRNTGAFPQPDEDPVSSFGEFGVVYLSGYDTNIVFFTPGGIIDLDPVNLYGKSAISPDGGIDIIEFKGTVRSQNLLVDKYDPTLQANFCYYYETIAGPSVCIDPYPFATNIRKVCSPSDISLSSQGAPVAVTKIEEEAFSSKTQFRIMIKNVGNGQVIRSDSMYKCMPAKDATGIYDLQSSDFDKLFVERVMVGTKPITCGPFIEGQTKNFRGMVRLINGEASIICDLPKSEYSEADSAYITPLQVRLSYVYKESIAKKVLIVKERSG